MPSQSQGGLAEYNCWFVREQIAARGWTEQVERLATRIVAQRHEEGICNIPLLAGLKYSPQPLPESIAVA